jgi:hypothetical protein
VLLFLVASRLLLNLPLFAGATQLPLAEGVEGIAKLGLNPVAFPDIWARWDSGYYLKIAATGYSSDAVELNFFPAYPALVRLLALGMLPLAWSGYLIANLAFAGAGLLLWRQVRREFGEAVAWATLITLVVFPTSFFFSAIYTESLFLLFSVLVYRFSSRGQYFWTGAFVGLASLTRINGFLLAAIPLFDIVSKRPARLWLRLITTSLISGLGLSLYMIYLWLTQGSPLAFLAVQQTVMKRSITFPGWLLLDSFAVIIWGHGGFADNWFVRLILVPDSLAFLLFAACAVLAFFILRPTSLTVYLALAVFLLSVSHGPHTLGAYAMSRYVLPLFPAFIVLGILLERLPRLKWILWAVSAIAQAFLTLWFGSGRWVA